MLIRLLHLEALGILYGLVAAVVYQMFTGQINLHGLLLHKDGSGRVSPERIQLLVATIAEIARFLGAIGTTQNSVMPDINTGWLYLLGGSSSVYVMGKAWKTWKANRNH
ncbi:MAG TPA: hypothetical protein VEI01_08075 [Terriglobales bacterium]|nr:hypothetical protein [Terriglobales bacterium]